MSTVLVVAAHPDDEILGVGATIRRLVNEGHTAYALILGEGQTSRTQKREDTDVSVVESLHENTLEACDMIGYKKVYFENLPDNRFDSVDLLDIVKVVEGYVKKLEPDLIYTHHIGDLNVDHQCTCRAVMTATRPMEGCPVKEIYCFETVSSTEWNFDYDNNAFKPNVFINVEKTFDVKLEAMKKYETELAKFPHPRSIRALKAAGERWGSVCGCYYAEAFELMRAVKR